MRHYSICTEESYLFWVRRFILFHGKRHPRELGEPEVGAFLAYLAVDRNVSASTQNQALNALVFLYKRVLERQLEDLGEVVRARRPERLPVVLTVGEVFELARQEARPRQEIVEEQGPPDWSAAYTACAAGERVGTGSVLAMQAPQDPKCWRRCFCKPRAGWRA